MSNTLTPETDAFEASQHPSCRFPSVLEMMRRLERERNTERALADAFANALLHEAGTGDVLPLGLAYDAWKEARKS